MMETSNLPRLYGEGGSAPSQPVDYPANLKTTQSLYMLFVVSEGEITNIEDIYLDDVSLGEFTASWSFTFGEVNQASIAHLNSTAITDGVDVPLPYEDPTGVVRPVSGDYEYVDIAVNFTQVVHITPEGDSVYAMVFFDLYTMDSYTTPVDVYVNRQNVIGKSDGQYQALFRVYRPATNNGDHEWGFRIVHSADSLFPLDDQVTMNIPYVTYYSMENVSNYPHSALIAIRLEDASQTANRIPTVSVRGSGIKLMMPSTNYYNADLGLYSNGTTWVSPTDPSRIPWDGTFHTVAGLPAFRYSNNLSWCIYNFLSDWLYFEVDGIRYPVGCDIPKELIAHFTFEEYARYCDELLSYQEYDGAPVITERRYTLNRQFYERKDVKVARDDMLTLGNAELVEYGGLVSIVWDRRFSEAEIDQSIIFTNQNVQNGIFEYASADITDNNTQINVTIQEINNRNRTRTVTVLVDELEDFLGLPRGHFIDLYGYTSSDFLMLGCASVPTAIRKGRNLLWDSLMIDLEGDGIVQFRCLIEAVLLHKGSPIRIHDSNMFDIVETGKVVSYTSSPVGISLILDRPITLAGITTLIVYAEDGTPTELMLEETSGTLTEVSAAYAGTLTLVPDSLFIQKSERTTAYKVTNITKEEDTYLIEATKYDERKYDFVEQVVTLPSTNNFQDVAIGKVAAVTNIAVSDHTNLADIVHKHFLLTWEHTTYPDRVYSYQITWTTSTGTSGQATVNSKSYNFQAPVDVKNVIYFFSIVAYNNIELPSKAVQYTFHEVRYDNDAYYDTGYLRYDGQVTI
jgi:predicted phage tail protein